MTPARGYAAIAADAPLAPFQFQRRDVGDHDVAIDILYCGICHTDIHQVRNEWGGSFYPMVPGHEIAGRVRAVGKAVKRFKAGDLAGVGYMVNSCRACQNCRDGEEQFCDRGALMTYNGREESGEPTYGGYSNQIVVNEDFVLKITHPEKDLAGVAPLLCAGITTYSPLRRWNAGPGKKVGVVGLGGLGHMGLKLAHAFGAHVVQFTTTKSKVDDAKRLGADEVILSNQEDAMAKHTRSFDFILDTVAAPHDLGALIGLLKRDATLTLVGAPDKPYELGAFPLIMGRRALAGSLIGGIRETQEMLDYCAQHQIVSDVEVIPVQQVNQAYQRMLRNDVKYRFSIDMASL